MAWGNNSKPQDLSIDEMRRAVKAWRGYIKHPDLADRIDELVDEIERLRTPPTKRPRNERYPITEG